MLAEWPYLRGLCLTRFERILLTGCQAFILYNTLRESDFYIFTALLTGGASALQVVGFGVLFYSVRIGKILAYIGALTFHLSAAVVFFYLYNYGLSGQKYLYFTMAYAAVTLIGGPIILINNEDIFLMVSPLNKISPWTNVNRHTVAKNLLRTAYFSFSVH